MIGDLIRRVEEARSLGLTVGDARKRLTEHNHDELHAHLDVDPLLWNGDQT